MVAFGGIMLWLRGVRIGSNSWNVKANFIDATGLSERSPVTFRGILIGEVGEIQVMPEAVQATLKIESSDLQLPTPVKAKLVKNSLLGGDVQIALSSKSNSIIKNAPLPTAGNCAGNNILCEGDLIEGESLTSISTLTTELERIVREAGQEKVIKNLVQSTKQFDKTQKQLEELIVQAKLEFKRAEPIITQLNEATMHINNIMATIDNPKTLNDIEETASNVRSLSKKIDSFGGDMNRIMADEELMNAIRSVTIGLGQFFNEVYPSKTNPPY
jgi:phospholipid/cholesterol/gamma-HCH transport system substrate-binding protein